MANIDYPGPCLSCSAIDGCSSQEEKKKAAASYCHGLQMELSVWKSRLYDVLVEVGELESSDQQKVADTLNLIKSTVKEIENIAASITESCPSDMSGTEKSIGGKLESLRANYTKALEVISPGWFGG